MQIIALLPNSTMSSLAIIEIFSYRPCNQDRMKGLHRGQKPFTKQGFILMQSGSEEHEQGSNQNQHFNGVHH